MYFETITFAPIDLDGIDPQYLSKAERTGSMTTTNKYMKKIAPHLTDEEREWLKTYTREI